MSIDDKHFMSIALNLAYRGLGNVAPNPAVGCVIVKHKRILSRGWTQPGGRPHAEYMAIHSARESVKGATMYVTLEPCVHYGKTAPCVDYIIKSGIKRVVIAIQDPDKRVDGIGVKKLEDNNLEVDYGICQEEAKILNIGYFYIKNLSRPYITVKLATTADGKIATKNGDSKWITNEVARNFAHKLRAQNDAIMVGSGTLLADNPQLNCRLSKLETSSPIKIIVDNKEKLRHSHLVLNGKKVYTFSCGKKVHPLHYFIKAENLKNGYVNLLSGVEGIAEHGVTRLLIEGGGKLVSSLIKDNIVDQIIWIRSNTLAGHDAISAIHDLNLHQISKLCKFNLKKSRKIFDNQIDFLLKPYCI